MSDSDRLPPMKHPWGWLAAFAVLLAFLYWFAQTEVAGA